MYCRSVILLFILIMKLATCLYSEGNIVCKETVIFILLAAAIWDSTIRCDYSAKSFSH